MTPKSALYFKALLSTFHPSVGESLLKHLPQEEVKQILSQRVNAAGISWALQRPVELLESVHYSWYVKPISKMPCFLQKAIATMFPSASTNALKKLLKLPAVLPKIPPLFKGFLLSYLFEHTDFLSIEKQINPKQLIPLSALTFLLDFSKEEMVHLIDYLSLYDLADAVRHIIDKSRLQGIYKMLSEKEVAFLRLAVQEKEKIAADRSIIAKWADDPKKLRLILHRRGMFRLSKALSGQSREFLWYVIHALDIGRGEVVEAEYEDKEIPNVTAPLILQVKSALEFIKKSR